MTTSILAQGIDSVPAPFLKNLMMVVLAFCVGAGAFAAFVGLFGKRSRRAEARCDRVEDGRARQSAVNVRQEVYEGKMGEVTRQLDSHERQLESIWETMREENKQIRDTLARAIRDFEGATERLEGTLAEVKEITARLLEKDLERNQ